VQFAEFWRVLQHRVGRGPSTAGVTEVGQIVE